MANGTFFPELFPEFHDQYYDLITHVGLGPHGYPKRLKKVKVRKEKGSRSYDEIILGKHPILNAKLRSALFTIKRARNLINLMKDEIECGNSTDISEEKIKYVRERMDKLPDLFEVLMEIHTGR